MELAQESGQQKAEEQLKEQQDHARALGIVSAFDPSGRGETSRRNVAN
jgi:hypothetical protein